jgi:tetratricopeptide (TPR) repeat protein
MMYYLRTVVIYLILFIGLSYGIQYGFHAYFTPEKGQETNSTNGPLSLQDALARLDQFQKPKQTRSGLFLAGMIAQNRRDWSQSWQNFSALTQNEKDNPDILLRSMTLALGNGDFDHAINLANTIQDNYLDTDNIDTKGEAYAFVHLFLTLNHIKNQDYDSATNTLNSMNKDGALYRLSNPIIKTWIASETDPDAINTNTKQLNSAQIYYKALAADYAGQKDKALTLVQSIDDTLFKIINMDSLVSLYLRYDEGEKAIDLLNTALDRFSNNQHYQDTLSVLENTPESYKTENYAIYHKGGVNKALSMAFNGFAGAMLAENATDSALLFARMSQYLDKDYVPALLMIGDIFQYYDQNDRAIAIYTKIPFENPSHDDVISKKSDLFIKQEQFQNALDIVNIALEKKPGHAHFHYQKGNILRSMKDYSASIVSYNRAEELGKNQDGELARDLWPLYYARAISYELSDQWERAEQNLMTALDKFPNSPLVLNYLGYAYADRNIHLDKAKKYISMAVMAAPNDPYITDSMGWILYRMGEYESALKYLERAIKMRPYHMVINDHLGDVYWKLGRKLEAHYMWKRAYDYFDPDDEEQARMIDVTKRKLKEGL